MADTPSGSGPEVLLHSIFGGGHANAEQVRAVPVKSSGMMNSIADMPVETSGAGKTVSITGSSERRGGREGGRD